MHHGEWISKVSHWNGHRKLRREEIACGRDLVRQIRVSEHRDRQGNGVWWRLKSSWDWVYQFSVEHKWSRMVKLAGRRNPDRLLQMGGLEVIVDGSV